MASFLSSLISRDPRAAFAYELPTAAVATVDGVQMGNSFKKVRILYVFSVLGVFAET